MNRLMNVLAVVLALTVFTAMTALAGQHSGNTVTTNIHDATSASDDIDVSCKDLSMDTAGTLHGTCQYEVEKPWGRELETKSTTLDLESLIVCYQRTGELGWGTGGFLDNTNDAAISLSSNGQAYVLAGVCDVAGGTDTTVDTLELGGRISNDDGNFKHSP